MEFTFSQNLKNGPFLIKSFAQKHRVLPIPDAIIYGFSLVDSKHIYENNNYTIKSKCLYFPYD